MKGPKLISTVLFSGPPSGDGHFGLLQMLFYLTRQLIRGKKGGKKKEAKCKSSFSFKVSFLSSYLSISPNRLKIDVTDLFAIVSHEYTFETLFGTQICRRVF